MLNQEVAIYSTHINDIKNAYFSISLQKGDNWPFEKLHGLFLMFLLAVFCERLSVLTKQSVMDIPGDGKLPRGRGASPSRHECSISTTLILTYL